MKQQSDPPKDEIERKDKADKRTKDEDKLNMILDVLTQMKNEMKVNYEQINYKIDKQNLKIEKVVEENQQEKEKVKNLDKRMDRIDEEIKKMKNEKYEKKEKKKDIESETIRKERVAMEGMHWAENNFSYQEQILEEARKWLGLVPINKAHVRKFSNNKMMVDLKEMNTP